MLTDLTPQTLRAERAARGWRQQDLADRAGCDGASISLIERGHRVPSAALLTKIWHALNTYRPHEPRPGGVPRVRL
jgi:transcriptional regulator with XRE-family HTH domain